MHLWTFLNTGHQKHDKLSFCSYFNDWCSHLCYVFLHDPVPGSCSVHDNNIAPLSLVMNISRILTATILHGFILIFGKFRRQASKTLRKVVRKEKIILHISALKYEVKAEVFNSLLSTSNYIHTKSKKAICTAKINMFRARFIKQSSSE